MALRAPQLMSKTALLFAGQGAQKVGMGKDWAEQSPTARALFDRANATLGYDLARLCFHGPDRELMKTEHAQPAIYLVSWVAFQLLKERVPTLDFTAAAGLSLGEFTALTAAGVMSFEVGLRLVRQRGRYMQEACEITRGAMAAVIGLDEPTTRAVCVETGVELANLNCPGQLVISGERDRVTRASELAGAKGARKVMVLPVAGAYHSRLMTSARFKLDQTLTGVPLAPPAVPVISNVTAQPHGTPSQIRALLVEQVTAPVRWEEAMRYLLAQGFARFIELGPGTVLSGFLKRIDNRAQCLNVADVASLEATVNALAS
jgi:[acyl-carrier-protein] S-malonyltransferase